MRLVTATEQRIDEKAATVGTEVELERVVAVELVVTAATAVLLVVVSVVYEVFLAAEQRMDENAATVVT